MLQLSENKWQVQALNLPITREEGSPVIQEPLPFHFYNAYLGKMKDSKLKDCIVKHMCKDNKNIYNEKVYDGAMKEKIYRYNENRKGSEEKFNNESNEEDE